MNKIKCHKCNHVWNTKSLHKKITCPSCLNKTFNNDNSTIIETDLHKRMSDLGKEFDK